MPTVRQRYGQTDGRTDGRLTIAIPLFALRASRGKNDIHGCHWLGWNATFTQIAMLVKKHVSRTAGCTDSSSHSFSKRATISGITKGAGDMPHTPNNFLASCVFFQAENVPKPLSVGAAPWPCWGILRCYPDPVIGWGGGPLRRFWRL